MGEPEKQELCRCGDQEEEHAEFIDNTFAGSGGPPERRHCKVSGCGCQQFDPASNPPRRSLPVDNHGLRKALGVPSEDDGKVVSLDEKREEMKDEEPRRMTGPGRGDSTPPSYREEPICEGCLNSKTPGILWPTSTGHIEKCDDCYLFVDDLAAAYFLSAVTGIPIKLDKEADGHPKFYADMSESLVKSMARALRIG